MLAQSPLESQRSLSAKKPRVDSLGFASTWAESGE